jgi:carbon monoxide dehydrogenase subunit G
MQLTHTFKVPATVDETWAVLNDLERVALCFPGASMDSVDGDTFAGTVRLKLGPIVMSYVGSGAFTSRDATTHRASLEAKGRDRSGNGTANVNVAMALTPQGAGTEVQVVTELAITGRAAQFGSGVITEVSDRLLLEFVGRLSEELGHPATSSAEAGGTGGAVGASAPDTLNFAQLVAPALAKQFGPPAFAAFVLAGLAFWLGRRRTT